MLLIIQKQKEHKCARLCVSLHRPPLERPGKKLETISVFSAVNWESQGQRLGKAYFSMDTLCTFWILYHMHMLPMQKVEY